MFYSIKKMKCRCEIYVIDNETKRKRKCKNNFKFDFLDKKICYIHFHCLYIKKIIKIQKVFRLYILRKKINYFKQLPTDLQHKIITYTKYNFNEIKRNEKISEIIFNKLDLFIKKYFNFSEQRYYLLGAIEFYNYQNNFNSYPNANYLINYLFYLFYILDKYQIIIKQEKFYIYNYRERFPYDISSMFLKFLLLQEKLLKHRNQLKNDENYKYINCVLNYKKLYCKN